MTNQIQLIFWAVAFVGLATLVNMAANADLVMIGAVALYLGGAFSVWNAFWGAKIFGMWPTETPSAYGRITTFCIGVMWIGISVYLLIAG